MRISLFLLILIPPVLFADSGSPTKDQVIFSENFEKRAPGERCDWKDYSTIKGSSFAGVTGITASPFDGGWHAYMFHRAADQKNGWALLKLKKSCNKAFRLTIDFMVPVDGGGSFELHKVKQGVWTALHLSAEKGLSIPITGKRKRKLMDLESHIWYQAEITAVSPMAKTFDLVILRHNPGKKPGRFEFKALPCLKPVKSLDRFKIQSSSGQLFYFDNLRLEALSKLSRPNHLKKLKNN